MSTNSFCLAGLFSRPSISDLACSSAAASGTSKVPFNDSSFCLTSDELTSAPPPSPAAPPDGINSLSANFFEGQKTPTIANFLSASEACFGICAATFANSSL